MLLLVWKVLSVVPNVKSRLLSLWKIIGDRKSKYNHRYSQKMLSRRILVGILQSFACPTSPIVALYAALAHATVNYV